MTLFLLSGDLAEAAKLSMLRDERMKNEYSDGAADNMNTDRHRIVLGDHEILDNPIKIHIKSSDKKFIQKVLKHYGLGVVKSNKNTIISDSFEVLNLDRFNLKGTKVRVKFKI